MSTETTPRKSPHYFFLLKDEGRTAVPCTDTEWEEAKDLRDKIHEDTGNNFWQVQETCFYEDDTGEFVTVSTSFLGYNSAMSATAAPLVWETCVFGGMYDLSNRKYSSRQAAEAGHDEMVAMVKGGDA